jgi:hypothetical protein
MSLPSKETVISERDKFPVGEILTSPDITPETQHMEAVIAEEITLPQPITDDTSQVIMDNAAPQQVTIKLPLTGQQMDQALHLKVIYSFRWLAEWMKRLLKIFGSKFLYRTGDESQ